MAGSETKEIQVFDMSSRAILRTFRGHDRAVRRTQFSPDGLNVLSGSDDGTVKLWDLSAEAEILTLEGHTDYVRATDVCESASHIHLSGSYDHTARLWDTRAGREVLSVDHGAPIESVLMFPGGSSFVTAGGNYVKVGSRQTRTLHAPTLILHTMFCSNQKYMCTHSVILTRSLSIVYPH